MEMPKINFQGNQQKIVVKATKRKSTFNKSKYYHLNSESNPKKNPLLTNQQILPS
jgi:hypothetical protein